MEIYLVELARWGALLVSAALRTYRRPGDRAAQARLAEVAAVLRRMMEDC